MGSLDLAYLCRMYVTTYLRECMYVCIYARVILRRVHVVHLLLEILYW